MHGTTLATPMSIDDRGRIVAALEFALVHHAGCPDRGLEACAAHLLNVSSQVLELGGHAPLGTAALLHDVFEHCPDVTRAMVRERFGDEVLGLVEDMTVPAAAEMPGANWKDRKAKWLERLQDVGDPSLMLAACERRHRLDMLLSETRVRSTAGLPRPDAARDLVWFNRQFLERARGRLPQRLWIELEDQVLQLESLVATQSPGA